MKNIGRGFLILVALLLLVLAGAVYFVLLGQWHGTSYAAGKTNMVKVYRIPYPDDAGEEASDQEAEASDSGEEQAIGNGMMVEAGSVVRGSKVTKYLKSVTVDGVSYRMVRADLIDDNASEEDDSDAGAGSGDAGAEEESSGIYSDGSVRSVIRELRRLIPGGRKDAAEEQEEDRSSGEAELYMAETSLADSPEETVLERDVYVRTPATIYKSPDSPDIASFAPKGAHLDIIGHDELLSNGYINMYKIRYTGADGDEQEGYVYGKYMTDNQEDADAHYNENGEYDKQSGDGFRFELYGGKATDLDLFPYEKTSIEGNEFCRNARAMYINAYAATHPKQYIKIIRKTDCNAVVIDLKDGPLTYRSKVAEKLSPTSYKNAYYSTEELRKGIEAYRAEGVYLIGRIVTFNDPYYAEDHPKDCIKYMGNSGWPSAYSRNVWEYNVKLAQEAVREFGLNEIQFDYVRFPESTYDMSKSGKANFRNKYGESKAEAVQNFCFYAADQLRESGAYISVDVFGESAYSYVTAYGQYWTAISNIVDAISAMPYTDHFSGGRPWEDPYGSVKSWAKKAAKQQKRLQDPAAARTWITGYDTPHWAPTVNYNEKRLKQQIKALEETGLDGGFIPWNALSDIGKYNQYKGIWNK